MSKASRNLMIIVMAAVVVIVAVFAYYYVQSQKQNNLSGNVFSKAIQVAPSIGNPTQAIQKGIH